jgi:hypothetical protein
MLPSPDELLRGLEFFARRLEPQAKFDVSMLADVLHEADALSAGRVEDEPAALFWACARRPRALAGMAHELVPLVAQNFANHVGLALDVEAIELDILRLRILRSAIAWDELRGWFAARLRPTAEGG